MNSITNIVKNNSKKALNNKFGRAIIIIMLYFSVNLFFLMLHVVISAALDLPFFVDLASTPEIFTDNNINISIPSIICSSTIAVITFLIVTPLQFGLYNWFYRLVGGENDEVLSVFYFFESTSMMFKSLWAKISVFFRIVLWSAVCFAPGIITYHFSQVFKNMSSTSYESMMYFILNVSSIILTILGVIFLYILSFRYFLVKYILISDKNISVYNAIKLSVKITKGNKVKLLKFVLSFFGWFLLTFLIAPILYVAPYYLTAKALYARVLIESYNSEEPINDVVTSNTTISDDFDNDANYDVDATKEMIINKEIEDTETHRNSLTNKKQY